MEQNSPAVQGPLDGGVRPLVELLRESADELMEFPHPSACDHLHLAYDLMRQAADEIERMTNWLEGDCFCPCCTETRKCVDGCTFASDCPNEAERMAGAREALFGAKRGN